MFSFTKFKHLIHSFIHHSALGEHFLYVKGSLRKEHILEQIVFDLAMMVAEAGKRKDRDKELLSQEVLKSKLYSSLYPFLLLLKVHGLFFTKSDTCIVLGKCCRKLPSPSQVFATLILVLQWANLLRFVLAIRGDEAFDSTSFLKVVYILNSIMSTTNATCLYVGCFRADLIPQLFVSWSGAQSITNTKYMKQTKVRSAIVSAVCVVGMWAIIGSFAKQVFTHPYFIVKYVPFSPGDLLFTPFKVIVFCFEFFFLAGLVLPLVLFCVLCSLLSKEFDEVNQELKEVVSDRVLLDTMLGAIRQRHVMACELVECADRFLNPLIAVTFSMSIVGSCLMGYLLLLDEPINDPFIQFTMIIWTVLLLFWLGLPCLFAVFVNSKVSKPSVGAVHISR